MLPHVRRDELSLRCRARQPRRDDAHGAVPLLRLLGRLCRSQSVARGWQRRSAVGDHAGKIDACRSARRWLPARTPGTEPPDLRPRATWPGFARLTAPCVCLEWRRGARAASIATSLASAVRSARQLAPAPCCRPLLSGAKLRVRQTCARTPRDRRACRAGQVRVRAGSPRGRSVRRDAPPPRDSKRR